MGEPSVRGLSPARVRLPRRVARSAKHRPRTARRPLASLPRDPDRPGWSLPREARLKTPAVLTRADRPMTDGERRERSAHLRYLRRPVRRARARTAPSAMTSGSTSAGRASSGPPSTSCAGRGTGRGSPKRAPAWWGSAPTPPWPSGSARCWSARPPATCCGTCVGHLDDDRDQEVGELGGITRSRSATRTSTARWSSGRHAFDAPMYIHAADREWVARPDDVVFWEGDTHGSSRDDADQRGRRTSPAAQVMHWRDGAEGRRRPVLRRHLPGGAGPPLGQLHVQLSRTSSPSARGRSAAPLTARTVLLRTHLRRVLGTRVVHTDGPQRSAVPPTATCASPWTTPRRNDPPWTAPEGMI